MGSGWAHSRACLLPLSLQFLSFVCRIFLPPFLLPARSRSSHIWDLWISSFLSPTPIPPESRLRKRSACTSMRGRHAALLEGVHAVTYGVRICAYELMGGEVGCEWACRVLEGQYGADGSSNRAHVAWQGGWGARFIVGSVIDGRRGRQGKEVLLLEGQGGGVLSSYYVYN